MSLVLLIGALVVAAIATLAGLDWITVDHSAALVPGALTLYFASCAVPD